MQDSLQDTAVAEVPESDKQFLLSMYRLAVDYYQPKIEQRTNTLLGQIHVWDYAKLHEHHIKQYRKSIGIVQSLIYWRRIQQYVDATTKACEERARKCGASYYENAIYVSFSSGCQHEEWIAEGVVHELTHALWYKLGGPTHDEVSRLSETDKEQLTLLSEGYSTFAQSVWFRDMYPLDARIDVGYRNWPADSVYEKGICKIRQIVNDCGPEILLEIPSRWRDF